MTPINKSPLQLHPDDPGIEFEPVPLSWKAKAVVWAGMILVSVVVATSAVLLIRWFPKTSIPVISTAILFVISKTVFAWK